MHKFVSTQKNPHVAWVFGRFEKNEISCLEILRAGETISAERVVVYPGVGPVLADAIEALYNYPFG